jgi:tRNA dimethylallyltransferase
VKTPLVVFIVGPTASGKSRLALELAQKMKGEIINGDSVQVYEGLDIGSAKPTKEEMEKVRHHLIGHVPKGQKYTAGRFRQEVLDVLKRRIGEGQKFFFVVGGSGFYLRALMTDLYKIPKIPLEIRDKIQKMSLDERYKKLQELDPEYSQKISSNDSYRISRGLEVCLLTGRKFSEIQREFSKKDFPYNYIKIGLKAPKELLREKVRERALQMLESGFVEEVRNLLHANLTNWAALESVGYKEVKAFLEGKLTLEELPEEIVKSTMALIKKQMTWFKKDSEIRWFDMGVSPQEVAVALQ